MNEIYLSSTPDMNGEGAASMLTKKEDMPVNMVDALADCTLRCVRQFINQPEGRSILDKKIAQLKAENIL